MPRANDRSNVRPRAARSIGGRRANEGSLHPTTRTGSALAIDRELPKMETMPLDQLRAAWLQTFNSQPPKLKTRDVLLRVMAWRIQAKALGRLAPATARKIRELSAAFARDPHHRLSPTPDLMPGTVLVREWKGVVHRVLVQRDGFTYDEQSYRSLTDVARAITGTAWSGPRFFGIEQGVKRANVSPGS